MKIIPILQGLQIVGGIGVIVVVSMDTWRPVPLGFDLPSVTEERKDPVEVPIAKTEREATSGSRAGGVPVEQDDPALGGPKVEVPARLPLRPEWSEHSLAVLSYFSRVEREGEYDEDELLALFSRASRSSLNHRY